ncbi:molybdopterin-dependent oxidoreductase [Ktedonospora formicarum]|uniref:Sulfite oxidase n=1 Tax=Ktedonospora formicarum TaxID=2778364 RepID=A0A8J3HUP1_9CHLR|nr:molybdopterin-dependent oxidoreductase [Ktedonospora formicarum]GHO42316.1 hypothetical protein KSX_04790 [Ktedonospora formicarum]
MSTTQQTERPSPARWVLVISLLGLGAGLASSLLATVVMGVLLFAVGAPTPVELFGSYVLKHLDVYTFVKLLITFSPNSKTTPLGLAFLAMLGIGTLLGAFYALVARVPLPAAGYCPGRREWICGLGLGLGMAIVGIVLFRDELRHNQYGLTVGWSSLVTSLSLLVEFGIYGVTLCFALRALLPKEHSPETPAELQKRRQFFSRTGVAVVGLASGVGVVGLLRAYLDQYSSYDGMKTLQHGEKTAPITPNDDHYIVTQNTVDPAPSISLWRLEVGGLINKAGSYTYEEVQKLPSISRAITLECISNGPGGRLMGTAIWQGVTLKALLEQHGGAKPEATHVAFYSVDGYNVSLPLRELLEADTLLAWRMNGQEIPQRHGFPMRVLVPGRYGEENAKWVTRVELTNHFVTGLYSSQGWYNGPLHSTSRIDTPRGKVSVGQAVEVSGVAYAGDREVKKVEVSTDGAQTWQEATIKTRLSPDAWVLWTWQWVPQKPGRYILVCRLTNGDDEVQTGNKQGTVPNGSTGYHEVVVQAV